jgi:hypothetical protein
MISEDLIYKIGIILIGIFTVMGFANAAYSYAYGSYYDNGNSYYSYSYENIAYPTAYPTAHQPNYSGQAAVYNYYTGGYDVVPYNKGGCYNCYNSYTPVSYHGYGAYTHQYGFYVNPNSVHVYWG